MDDTGLPNPIINPAPPTPQVPVENPQIQKPVNQTVRGLKKLAPKLVAGAFVVALLVGGAFLGVNQVQKQQVVEQQAAQEAVIGPCKDNKTKQQCDKGCSLPKGPNNINYECRWDLKTDECKDSDKYCPEVEGGQEKCLTEPVNCYYCPNQFVWQQCPSQQGGGFSSAPLPAGVGYDVSACKITGRWCGMVQCDSSAGSSSKIDNYCNPKPSHIPSPSPSPSASPSASPSPSVSPTPSLTCVDLTKNKPAPQLNDVVTFTCQANFSSVNNQRAYFRYSIDNGATFITPEPAAGVAIDATTKKASHNITISQPGNWEVQCRVCARPANGDPQICTAWGRANVP